jgi:hypothetical protein
MRKFIYPSPLVILAKYIVLFPVFFFAFNKASRLASIMLLAITLPLLATIHSFPFIPYAIYDLIAIFYLPVLIFSIVLCRNPFEKASATKILSVIALIGIINSLLVIVQSLLGPQHWLSQTVDQSFTLHTWGAAFKAPGLAGTSSPYMSIAGLISLDILSKNLTSKKSKRLNASMQFLIILSSLFNLTSRTYSFGLLSYLVPFVLLPLFSRGLIKQRIILLLLLPLAYFVLQSNADEWGLPIFQANRSVDDFASAADRLIGLPILLPFTISPSDIPFIGGLGLGYTVNNNPLVDPSSVTPFCSSLGLGTEGEYERLICSFGFFGSLHILSRLFIALVALRRFVFHIQDNHPYSISSGWLVVALVLANGIQLKANDPAAGFLLILIALSASESLFPPSIQKLSGKPNQKIYSA